MTNEEIHNIYLHMSGKAEGLVEATGEADFPVLFARAILEYKKQWVGLTDEEFEKTINDAGFTRSDLLMMGACVEQIVNLVEAKLKERNT